MAAAILKHQFILFQRKVAPHKKNNEILPKEEDLRTCRQNCLDILKTFEFNEQAFIQKLLNNCKTSQLTIVIILWKETEAEKASSPQIVLKPHMHMVQAVDHLPSRCEP